MLDRRGFLKFIGGAAVGTHAELLQTSPLYGRLWESHTGARDAEGAEHD